MLPAMAPTRDAVAGADTRRHDRAVTALAVDETDPTSLLRLGLAFCESKALLSAVELGVFDALHESGSSDVDALVARLGLHPRAARNFLDLLVELGLLTRVAGRYANGPGAARHLVRGDASPIRELLDRANRMHYAAWGGLTDALRTGGRRPEADYSVMPQDPQRLRRFLRLMDALTTPIGPLLAEAVDWAAVRRVADVGGGRGHLLSYVLTAHPHLSGVVFDLPHNAGHFAEYVAARGLVDRVTFQPGDFFADPLPAADALIFGHVLHDWSPQRRTVLVRRAYDALGGGGLLVVYEGLLGADAVEEQLPRHPATREEQPDVSDNPVAALDMLLFGEGSSEYTERECRQLLTETGFDLLAVRPLGERDTLVVARKP